MNCGVHADTKQLKSKLLGIDMGIDMGVDIVDLRATGGPSVSTACVAHTSRERYI